MHKAGPARPLRFVSAASLFDGHDAAINLVRRLLQAHGAEVVHLGHNRSVAELVRAAVQEDADAIAVSSYQGGHNEYFRYLIDQLREQGVPHVRVVVGGGGTITPEEIAALEAYGVEKIYTPEDGRRLGLDGMIEDVLARVRATPRPAYRHVPPDAAAPWQLAAGDLGAGGRRRGCRRRGRRWRGTLARKPPGCAPRSRRRRAARR
ncbi:MAG: cobalamin-dependent protein [Steroidobacteraceae bacterium]